MTSRPLGYLSASLLLAFALGAAFGGCGLSTYGLPDGTEAGTPCSTAAQCDDGNPCTVDACTPDGTCTSTPGPDGDLHTATPGDCKKKVCAAGQPKVENDDANAPADTPCSKGTCSKGVPETVEDKNGTPCTSGAAKGQCSAGTCKVACGMVGDPSCDDHNPCTEDSCDLNTFTCVFVDLNGVPTPGAAPEPGTCRRHVCSAGLDVNSVDDTNLPAPSNECVSAACNSGTPTFPALPNSLDKACNSGGGKHCDGNGNCVECTQPTECGTTTQCKVFACTLGKCGTTLVQSGTPVTPNPHMHDCKQEVCDGSGGTKTADEDSNLPVAAQCYQALCKSGVPSTPPQVAGFSCGTNLLCDGNGVCVGCLGIDASTCPVGNACKTATCSNKVCGFSYATAGTLLNDALQNCQKEVCDGAGKTVSIEDDADLPPPSGTPCITTGCSMGVPSQTVNLDVSCMGTEWCSAAGACVTCNTNGECPASANECRIPTCTGANTCTTTPEALGFTIATQVQGDCKVNQCDANGNVVSNPQPTDLPANTSCATGGCNGSMPIFTPFAVGTVCGSGLVCDGNGTCGGAVGQACTKGSQCGSTMCVDGYCCSSACTTPCMECDLPSALGTCSDIPAGSPDPFPANACNGVNLCDGKGNCKSINGQGCSGAGTCESGNCVDGTCCKDACTGTCKACNVPGSLGTCSDVPAGQADNFPVNACNGTNLCDGKGNCKAADGQTCGASGVCETGNCVDGYCCDTACGGICQACNVPGSLGTCSPIPLGGTDASPVCAAPNKACDGAGNCKDADGQTCAVAGDCATNFCVGLTCCNSACSGTCTACNVVGSLGTCTSIPEGQPDNVNGCTGTNACDGSGNCKKVLGQLCTLPTDCDTGFCALALGGGSVCCASGCAAACHLCNPTSDAATGICEFSPMGFTDARCLPGPNHCDGAGNCM